MITASAWDHAGTARMYERFCRRHRRYRIANDALAAHARLESGMRVLDVAAGTGRTTEALLPRLGNAGRVLCVEPATAMRVAGAKRLRDARVTWLEALPNEGARFDRVVCGAAVWQLLPLEATIARLSGMLATGGALVFNMPAQYLREPDRPGGGRDPFLLELPTLIERSPAADESRHAAGVGGDGLAPSARRVEQMLMANQLRVDRWSFDVRITQAAYRDWLKIPPTSDGMLAGLPIAERARRIDRAYALADRHSWRWERWLGWTAWRAP
jgi:trans-aconitate methyltransferase